MHPFPKKFWPFCAIYAKLYKWQICAVFLLSITEVWLINMNNRLFADITGAIKLGDADSYGVAMRFVWLLAICGICSIIASQISRYYFNAKFLVACRSRLEKDLFAYLLGHSYEYITTKQSGMLIQQKEQVKKLPELLESAFGDLRMALDILIKAIMLMCVSPIIGGGYLLCAVLVMFPGRAFAKPLSRVSKARSKMSAIVDGRMLDIVNNLPLIKQYDNINDEKRHLHPLLKQEYILNQKNMLVSWGQYNLIGVITSLLSFIILLLGVYYWSIGAISTADIVFILITLTLGLSGLSELQYYLQQDRQAIATIEQGLEPFAEPHGIVDAESAKAIKPHGGKIEFRHIDFAYKGARKPIFKDFNLVIKAGEKVGIAGASGSGKSTLINLLQRSYEPDSGEILIDGQNITAITQESLHRAVSLIPQDTVMFNRRIADNIAFGTENCNRRKIKKAAQKAYADDFICDKEGGYDAFAGDRGCLLSGGERQRIAIARAILRNAPVLVLDEATSALDSESEILIQKALENLIKNQTVIAIAHRLSTLKNMDRILVLDKGKICEEGTFEELLSKGGKFAKLYAATQRKGGKNV